VIENPFAVANGRRAIIKKKYVNRILTERVGRIRLCGNLVEAQKNAQKGVAVGATVR